jgi:hypothetical protein
MKALTSSVSVSLRQSAMYDHGGSAGRSLMSLKRRPVAQLTQLGRRVNSCPAATAPIRLVPLSCSLLMRGLRPMVATIFLRCLWLVGIIFAG